MANFRNVYTALLIVITGSPHRELTRQVTYLKAENQILRRRLPDRISLTQREKNRLDHFVIFGSRHMDVLCQEFKVHYQEERPQRIRFRFLRFIAKNGAADYSRATAAKRRNSSRRSTFSVAVISYFSALVRVTRTSVRTDAC
jgi:hypothetical protein